MNSPFSVTLAQAGADIAPAPGGSTRTDSADRSKARRDMANTMEDPASTVLPAHRMAFHWLRSGDDEFGLVSCFVNGYPSALVVAAREDGNKFEIMPLFVALSKGMTITAPDGEVIYANAGVA